MTHIIGIVTRFSLVATAFTLLSCGNSSPSTTPAMSSALGKEVEIARWEANMKIYGEKLCTDLSKEYSDFDHLLIQVYYDAQWVFQQMADYTGESKWLDCAAVAEKVYRDQYVIANRGNIPGFWVFPHGIAQDYLRNDDQESLKALDMILSNAAFVRPGTKLSELESTERSRETAYAIHTLLEKQKISEQLTASQKTRLDELKRVARSHLDQWFISRTATSLKPFMVGISSNALIAAYEQEKDAQLIPLLVRSLDELWARAWDDDAKAFRYLELSKNEREMDPAPDLNLLIAPAYLWVYRQTNEPRFKQRAISIFNSGVENAWIERGKQFNQNYRWSFFFVRWLQDS